ncbi:MAG: hypothetical protein ABDH91_05880 [Bacteroidia bacterium]
MGSFPILIPSAEEFFRILDLAEKRQFEAEVFLAEEGYYENSVEKHKIGLLGEWGAWKWLYGEEGLRGVYWEADSGVEDWPDLRISVDYEQRVGVEVKTWRLENWQKWGRSLPVEQYPLLCRRSTLVIWCAVLRLRAENRHAVQIMGWNWLAEMPQKANITSMHGQSSCLIYQLHEKAIRSPKELVQILKKERARLLGR